MVVFDTASGGVQNSIIAGCTSVSELVGEWLSVMCMYLFIDRLVKAFRGEVTLGS